MIVLMIDCLVLSFKNFKNMKRVNLNIFSKKVYTVYALSFHPLDTTWSHLQKLEDFPETGRITRPIHTLTRPMIKSPPILWRSRSHANAFLLPFFNPIYSLLDLVFYQLYSSLICMDLAMWSPNRKSIFSTVRTSFFCRKVLVPISTVENIFCAQLLSPFCTKTLSIMKNHSSLISHDAWHLSPITNHPG